MFKSIFTSRQKSKQTGFTLIELLVVMALMIFILSFASINLTGLIPQASLRSTADALAADLRLQQLKAMAGDSDGGVSSSFGVYFENNRYTVFRGASYNPADPNNFVLELATNLEIINLNFPSQIIIFSAGSGEITGYAGTPYTLTMRNTQTNQTEQLTLNQYGVITIARDY